MTATTPPACNSVTCYDRYAALTVGEGPLDTPMQWRVGVLTFIAAQEICTKHLEGRRDYVTYQRRQRLSA